MTFSDISVRVLDRLNLTSTQATVRVAQEIDERYREVATGLGLEVTTTGIVPVGATTTVGVRTLTFTGVEKIMSVYNTAFTPPATLDEVDFDEIRNQPVGTDPPSQWAVQSMGASTVTIFLDTTPATAYLLTADALSTQLVLTGSMIPQIPTSFHDILLHGVIADELYKLEKYDLAAKKEEKFEKRLSELRFFIAKSAYKKIYQGKNAVMGGNMPAVTGGVD